MTEKTTALKRTRDGEEEPVVEKEEPVETTVEDNNDVDDTAATDKPKRKRKRKRKATNEQGGGKEEADASREAKLASLDHTVYVEGIPFDCSEEDVKEFFSSHGCEDVIQMRLPR